jgi:lipopolysaccharide transport system ATP-binding protein
MKLPEDITIRAEGIGKRFEIGRVRRRGYRTLRDTIASAAAAPFRRRAPAGRGDSGRSEPFWALRDVNFEIARGEVVGIIGANGAGKSTLLKILARITDPSEGEILLRGRVGSLLEVGTGFHAELTGRENVYLNGAILGMRKREIDRHFDAIVAFAEVERFIDTPVKHYSSGMYLRLAFSVAAHLETEILLVDEVLAVGDVNFQKKCLGKMENVAATGKTVLFVSHNLGVVKELCQTSLVIRDGAVAFRGPVVEGLLEYTKGLGEETGAAGSGTRWHRVSINGEPPGLTPSIEGDEPFTIEARLDVVGELKSPWIFCIVNDALGANVVHQRVGRDQRLPHGLEAGSYRIRVALPNLWLHPSVYTIYFKSVGFDADGNEVRAYSERVALDVTASFKVFGRAALAPPLRWTFERESDEPGGGRAVEVLQPASGLPV